MIILACMVIEKSLTKNFITQSTEGKIIEQIQGRKKNRRKLALSLTIQQTVISLHTKYDHSSLHDCGEIFDEKFLQDADGRKGGKDEEMEGRTNGQTLHFFKAEV